MSTKSSNEIAKEIKEVFGSQENGINEGEAVAEINMPDEISDFSKLKLHPHVSEALKHPQKSMEMRGWLKTHQDVARHWRGEDGETMMHWSFLSHWSFSFDLLEAGLDYNVLDDHGRTPMDWLLDRLWAALVDEKTSTRLSAGGKERLLRHSEEQISTLWQAGARPSNTSQRLHPGVVWIRSGSWDLLSLLTGGQKMVINDKGEKINIDEFQSIENLMNWTPKKGHALHAWILSPNTPGRAKFLSLWLKSGLSLDVRDEDGRTPLWYAVDAWVFSPIWRPHLNKVIQELCHHGADPYAGDRDGVAPLGLILREGNKISVEDQQRFFNIFGCSDLLSPPDQQTGDGDF